jgi:hypothetical protein
MAQKTRPMKSTLPRAIPNPRRCTEMLTRWSPSGLNLRSSPVDFELCWSIWESPPLPSTRSRKSRVQVEWSSRPSQRFSSDPGSSADIRDQPSGLRAVMLLPMPPGRPSHHGSIATRAGCRTRSTTSYLPEEGSIQGLRGEKGYPRMEMVHHEDVAVQLSTHLLTAQHEIETLRAQLRNTDATIRGYGRMVDGQASDLYVSDTDTGQPPPRCRVRARSLQ